MSSSHLSFLFFHGITDRFSLKCHEIEGNVFRRRKWITFQLWNKKWNRRRLLWDDERGKMLREKEAREELYQTNIFPHFRRHKTSTATAAAGYYKCDTFYRKLEHCSFPSQLFLLQFPIHSITEFLELSFYCWKCNQMSKDQMYIHM